LKEYAIHESLALELQKYLESTKSREYSQLDTLFVQKPHHTYLGFSQKVTSRYYTYSRYLLRMIEPVRKGLGHTEDKGHALLKLQRSSEHYSMFLWEGMERGSISWQDQEK
jgi:hypothetical protein